MVELEKPVNCPPITALICALNGEASIPHVLPKIPDWVDEILRVDGHITSAFDLVTKRIRR